MGKPGQFVVLTLILVNVLGSRSIAAEVADEGDWAMPGKNYSLTRFSSLDQINTSTVTNLKVAWTFSTGVNRGQEAAPIIVSNTMFIITPYPNILYALDLASNGAAKWK